MSIRLKKVKIVSEIGWPYCRQMSDNNNLILLDEQSDSAVDILLVVSDLSRKLKIHLQPKGLLICSLTEPPDVRSYNFSYLSQFDVILSPYTLQGIDNVIIHRPLLPWMVGRRYLPALKNWESSIGLSFGDLAMSYSHDRLNRICVITSNKSVTFGHEIRLSLISALKKSVDIDIFGVGFSPVEDKLKVYLDYKYVLVIENSSIEDYWTEKLSDAIISECVVFYYGSPNVSKYLFGDSLILLESLDLWHVKSKIEDALSRKIYENSKSERRALREKVMCQFNIFTELSKLGSGYENPLDTYRTLLLKPSWYFEKSMWKKIMNILKVHYARLFA